MGTITAPWKQLLLNALESNSHLKHSAYFQFATVGCNGRPFNRTLVFRGFQDNSDKLHINTDDRSHKIKELKQCPFAEICWYFTDSREQFRISGKVDVIDGSNPDTFKLEQREKSWFAGSARSRIQYLGPIPSLPRLSEHGNDEEVRLDPSIGPVDAFCLLVLDPDQVLSKLMVSSLKKESFSDRIGHETRFTGRIGQEMRFSGRIGQETGYYIRYILITLIYNYVQVDYLNLKNNQSLKFISTLDMNGVKSWSSERIINP